MPNVANLINQFNQMSTVNNGLTWGQVSNMRVGGNRVGLAFKYARIVRLPVGMEVYKFNGFPNLRTDHWGHVTPWWSPYLSYDVDPGWNAKVNMARTLGNISVRELGRVTSAVSEDWNSCAWLVVIRLRVPINVAYGGFAQQPRNHGGASRVDNSGQKHEGRGASANLPGGGRQFFIPNLEPRHFTVTQSRSLLNM